jgi:cytochrome c peroxidase
MTCKHENGRTTGAWRRACRFWHIAAKLMVGAALVFMPASGVQAQKAVGSEEANWTASDWTAEELAKMRGLWIGNLPALKPDPTNKYGDDPRAADFGHHLFFDTRLSSNGKVACATCHKPQLNFTDGKPVAVGVGVTNRNAPTLIGASYNRWFFWDGRKDSQWSQALASIENVKEHNMPRDRVVDVLRRSADYRARYEAIFGRLPAPDDKEGTTRAFVNIGKAIAAYQRKLVPAPAKFDRYVAALIKKSVPAPADRLSLDERLGLKVFLSDQRGRCVQCHNGPLLSNQAFHNIGVPFPGKNDDEKGRINGIKALLKDPFNCAGKYSDAKPGQCVELTYLRKQGSDLVGAFKSPTLRNLGKSGPYMHNGSMGTLEDVTWHYRTSPAASLGKTELEPFVITDTEFDQLEAFLRTLDGPIAAPGKYLKAPERLMRRGY